MKGLPLLLFIVLIAGGVAYFVSNKDSDTPNTNALVTSFNACVKAGNPIMESYPRQCSHNGTVFFEDIDSPKDEESSTGVLCEEEERGAFCTQQYQPVCGLTQVECITTPCDPVEQTYGNACTACSNERVISYTEGICNFF